jgi:hypothetical protein
MSHQLVKSLHREDLSPRRKNHFLHVFPTHAQAAAPNAVCLQKKYHRNYPIARFFSSNSSLPISLFP